METAVERGDHPRTLIVMARPSDADGIGADTVVLGVSLLQRALLNGRRAGFDRVLIAGTPLLKGSGYTEVGRLLPEAPLPAGRVVVVADQVLATTDWLQELAAMPVAENVVEIVDDVAAVANIRADPLVSPMVAAGFDVAHPASLLPADLTVKERHLRPTGRCLLSDTKDLPATERWLLRSLIKDTEGFMSRHVERPISLAITRRLCRTAITPNAMTLISVGVGLLSAPFFLSGQAIWQTVGALLFLAHSILDGCDGELARLTYRESRWGGLLDFWGDNIVHVAVFGAMMIGAGMQTGSWWPYAAGASAVLTSAISAALVYWCTMRPKVGAGPLFTSVSRADGADGTPLRRILDALTRRDFIYLILVLAVFGKAAWFLILAGIGAPIFLIALLVVVSSDSKRGDSRRGDSKRGGIPA
ncbi:MAG: CDP-alcohol phosphatidyltransferase family protein [Rhodospirillales bacterium]|nr:CDP-alcohol phosphatidyltransferase family protein [Rhodospirillales bacterium]